MSINKKIVYTIFIFQLICCGRMPNYFPPVSYSYYPGNKFSGNIGLSLLSGLYISGSANVNDIILISPNINFLGFDHTRLGIGLGKNFSLLKEKHTSLNITPLIFTNFINFKGEENKSSPHIRGIELFPDVQFSFQFFIAEIYAGFKGILIPYANVRWEEYQTIQQENYSNPFQVFLPAVYGGVSIGKYLYINGGITYILSGKEEVTRTEMGKTNKIKERLNIAPFTISVGLRVIP